MFGEYSDMEEAITDAYMPAEMAKRAENGMDTMMQNALNGLNTMPARGGRPDLSDEQVQAVIEFMLQ